MPPQSHLLVPGLEPPLCLVLKSQKTLAIERCLPCRLFSYILWSQACSLFISSLEICFTPSPIFIATTSLSIIPLKHSPACSSWTTSHFIRRFIRKGRKKWGSSKWLPSFADFFVLPQKAFLHLSWRIQAQSRETPPVDSNSTPFTGIHSWMSCLSRVVMK